MKNYIVKTSQVKNSLGSGEYKSDASIPRSLISCWRLKQVFFDRCCLSFPVLAQIRPHSGQIQQWILKVFRCWWAKTEWKLLWSTKILLLNVNLALLSIYFIYLYRKFVQFSLRKFRFVSNRIPLRSLRRYRNFWPVFFRSEKFNLILNCISCGNLQFKLWDLKFLQSMSLNVDTKLVVLIETYLQWEEKSWVWDTSSDRLRNQLQIQLE